jgi:hypothetical protein
MQNNAQASVLELKRICYLHFSVAVFLGGLQSVIGRAAFQMSVLSFCNAICLAERFWRVQRRTMDQWSVSTQICFLMSRVIVAMTMVFIAAILFVFVQLESGLLH